MVLDKAAVQQLGENVQHVHESFNKIAFTRDALDGIKPLSISQRSEHIAVALRKHLADTYSKAIGIMLKSLTPPLEKTKDNGLAVLFYMPHCHYIAKYGLDKEHNNGEDPFDISMHAQYELTKRFTCEFSIRPFIINDEARTMKVLYKWMKDTNPHVRRLCSEGTRPRLPWAMRIPSFVNDPSPTIPVLEKLKNDPDLYVRRSVANHIGDIAKDNLELALTICDNWLTDASTELKWVIRHALRHPAKKGDSIALKIRKATI